MLEITPKGVDNNQPIATVQPESSRPSLDLPRATQPQQPMMKKEEIEEIIEGQPWSLGLTFTVAATVIVALFSFIFYGLTVQGRVALQRQQAIVGDLQNQLQAERMAEINQQYEQIQQKIALAETYFNQPITWSSFFNELSKLVPKQVQLTNFSVSDKSVVVIEGTAADYSQVAKVLLSVDNHPGLINGELSSVSISEKGIGWAIKAKIKEGK